MRPWPRSPFSASRSPAAPTVPSYPLLTPVEVARGFGFSDTRLPDGRYEISYVAPTLQGFGYRFDQSPTEKQGKSLAFDMAIWRAAQIAQAQGFQGFTVADTKSNSDIQQRSAYYDDPWGPGWGGTYWGRHRSPFGWNDYNPPETSVQVEVKLAVALSNNLKPGDYNAADAIQQLASDLSRRRRRRRRPVAPGDRADRPADSTPPDTTEELTSPWDNLRIDGARLWHTLMETAKIGGTPKGGINRQALTDLDGEVRHQLIAWAKEAGCTVTVDQVGNIFCRRPGRDPSLPPVGIGSHLDTQPTGGKFDGILGVLAGLELIRTLNDANYETEAPIELINWTNEEGARFAPAMLASGVFTGRFTSTTRWAVPTATARASATS